MIRIIVFVLFVVVALTAIAQYRSGTRWENISSFQDLQTQTTGDSNDEEPGVKMTMREGYLIIITDHTVNVKVVSVLGKHVSDVTLDAGTWRMPLRTRGIYVVRAGKCARRVKVN